MDETEIGATSNSNGVQQVSARPAFTANKSYKVVRALVPCPPLYRRAEGLRLGLAICLYKPLLTAPTFREYRVAPDESGLMLTVGHMKFE